MKESDRKIIYVDLINEGRSILRLKIADVDQIGVA